MQRLAILDGFRGFFLLFMSVAHLNMVTDTWLGNIHPQRFGWIDGAQGFVFVSGLVAGMFYGRTLLREGAAASTARILRRAGTVYLCHAGLILLLLAAAMLLVRRAPADLTPYLDAPVAFTVSSLALVSSSMHMGILPMYVAFLLVTPLALALLRRELVAPYFAAIILGWMSAQTGLFGWGLYLVEQALREQGIPVRFGLYFNWLGWQVLFFSGLFAGFRVAQRRLDLGFLARPQMRIVWFMALGAFAMLGVYDVIVENGLFGSEHSGRAAVRWPRSVLGPIYVFAFAVDLYLVVWLLHAGGTDPLRWVRGLAAAIRWLFTRPAFMVLGQHSLQVFIFHIVVYYVMATAVPLTELSGIGRAAVLLMGVASLYLAAFAHAWWQARGEAQRAPATARHWFG